MRRVVVTGMGAITPIGNNLEEYNQGLSNGISGAHDITLFDASQFATRFACEVKNFNPEDYLDRKEARKSDRFTQFALVVAEEAIQHSKLDVEQLEKDRAGVIWGSGIGGLKSLEEEIEYNVDRESPRYSPFMITKMIANIAPGMISIKYGFRGVSFGTVSACTSATHAIMVGLDNIRLNRADVMIVGGSEAAITKAGIGGFASMRAMSRRNDDPSTASRPFDGARDGFVLGEGGGALILEELEHAKRRGAQIFAEVKGAFSTSDAYHMTAPHPEGIGASSVMQGALVDAGMSPSEIDYINVHGTSTPLGDTAELKAIQSVFHPENSGVAVSSTKSMTGHLLGAAGAIEAIAGILAIQNNYIPPTINVENIDPEIDDKLNLIVNSKKEQEINAILSNTFGFGGHNASVIFAKY